MFKIKNIKKVNSVLLIIIIIAVVVRYWGIDFGLPNTRCRPDESTVVDVAFKFGSGDLNPHLFKYPTFYMYILFCFYACYFLFGIINGRYSSISDLLVEFGFHPTNFYLIDRCFSAFLGTATVFITYKIAKQLFNKKTGIISALFLSLAYLHVRDSHFGVTDVPMTFLIMCSLLFIIKSYEDKTLKSFVIAGIFAGLATSTKYAGILLIVPISIVNFFNILDRKDKKIRLFLDKQLLLFMTALVFTFFLGTPFALFDFTKFISDFLLEMKHLNLGWGIILRRGWWHHLSFSLRFGLGWTLFFASLAGILILIKKDLRKTIILCSFPLVYYALSGKGYTVFLRYIIPVIPFLCITGAVFTVDVSNKIAGYFRSNLKNVITYLIMILIIMPSIYNIINFNRLLAKKDNRLIAKEWIDENIQGGSSIYQPGSKWGKIELYPTIEALEKVYKEMMVKGGGGRTLKTKMYYLKAKIDYLKKENIQGYEDWKYNSKLRKFSFNDEEKDTLPKYIVRKESPLVVYSRTPEEIMELLKTSYYLKKSFKVIDINNKDNLFDQQDAFYIPFVGFRDIQRPGPNIYIYETLQGSH
jgi:4-amino-4-deoxy-L-arabinose transferase-like glycosyltransferase